MEKHELMIGNYVECENLRPAMITGIHNSFCYYSFNDKDNSATWNFCKPILLTEEWLIKLGFELNYLTFDKDKISIHMSGLTYPKGRIYYNSWYIVDCFLYVHQLQNLYFALTGQQLKLKE